MTRAQAQDLRGAGGVAVWIVLTLILAVITAVVGPPKESSAATRTDSTTTTTTTTTAPSTTEAAAEPVPTTTTSPPTTAAPTTTTTTAPPARAAAVLVPTGGRFTLSPYAGLGTWVDVFDWTMGFTKGSPGFGLGDVDRMAALGIQTMYLQAARWDVPEDVVERDLLMAIINRAHANGIQVVGWYLPDLNDPADDMRKLRAMAALPIEGIGVDIESRSVPDVAERNARLINLSATLRAELPGEVISAIVLPPVVMEDVNPNYWPGHPWQELAPYYDVWQTMGYWTNRLHSSGWRDAYSYTAANIDRVRAHIGNPNAVVHPIGGIGDETTPADIAGMVQACVERGCVGGSLYDYRTTSDEVHAAMRAFIT